MISGLVLSAKGPRSDREIINSVLGGWHRFLDAFEEALAGDVVDHDKPELDYAKIEVRGRE